MNYPFFNAVKDLIVNEKITVSQFAEKLGFLKGNLHKKVYPLLFNLIDSHDTARFLHNCENKKEKQRIAAAIQLLCPGMPMIYYGDEFAMEGGPDPDCRRGMLWDEKRQDKEMFAWYQRLIYLRKTYRSITEGNVIDYQADDEKGVLVVTRELGDEKVTIVFNCKEGEAELSKYQGMQNLITEDVFDGKIKGYNAAVLLR